MHLNNTKQSNTSLFGNKQNKTHTQVEEEKLCLQVCSNVNSGVQVYLNTITRILWYNYLLLCPAKPNPPYSVTRTAQPSGEDE